MKNRSRFFWRQGLALCLLAGVAVGSKAEAGRAEKPESIAWAILTNQDGKWQCEQPPDVVVPALIKSGVRYVRVGGAAGPRLEAGIPDDEMALYYRRMRAAGMKLGVVLYTQNRETSDEQLVEKAKFLKQSGYYDWILVDSIKVRPRIQWIVDELRKAGWDEIMINTSPWGKEQPAPVPQGCWAYARMFSVLERDQGPYLGGQAVLKPDHDYVRKVREGHQDGIAVVKLEIPWQIDRFKALPALLQKRLLTEWSEGQRHYGYTMIYPLFTGTGKGEKGRYDSIAAGTFAHQVQLIRENNRESAEGENTLTGKMK